jgi:hypothetical protein
LPFYKELTMQTDGLNELMTTALEQHVAKHTMPARPSSPKDEASAAISMPASAASSQMGGGGCHPSVAKHLRAQASA